MAITQNHIINIQPGVSAPLVIHCSQGDTGSVINLTVVNGDETFDCSSYVCSVHGVRSDGANWGPYEVTVSGSTVSFSLRQEMTAIAGPCLAEITIGTVGTANFAILVENATFSLGVTYTEDVSLYQSILSYNMGAVQNIKAEATAGINKAIDQMNANTNAINAKYDAAIDQMNANTNAINAKYDAATTNFNQAISTTQNQYAVTNAKLDTAISAATQDSEVQDIRVKADGTFAATAGNAVREQITELKNELNNNVVSTNPELNGILKELYTTTDLSSVTRVREYNNFSGINALRFYDSSNTRLFQIYFSGSSNVVSVTGGYALLGDHIATSGAVKDYTCSINPCVNSLGSMPTLYAYASDNGLKETITDIQGDVSGLQTNVGALQTASALQKSMIYLDEYTTLEHLFVEQQTVTPTVTVGALLLDGTIDTSITTYSIATFTAQNTKVYKITELSPGANYVGKRLIDLENRGYYEAVGNFYHTRYISNFAGIVRLCYRNNVTPIIKEGVSYAPAKDTEIPFEQYFEKVDWKTGNTINEHAAIGSGGNIIQKPSNSMAYSEPISVKKGWVIITPNTTATYYDKVSVAKVVTEDSLYDPIAYKQTASGQYIVIDEDCEIALCAYYSDLNNFVILKGNIATAITDATDKAEQRLYEQLYFKAQYNGKTATDISPTITAGKIIDAVTGEIKDDSEYSIAAFTAEKGKSYSITYFPGTTYMQLMGVSLVDGDNVVCFVKAASNTMKTVYIEGFAGTVRVNYRNNVTPTIKGGEIATSKVGGGDQFINAPIGGQIIYEADTKSNSGYIVNAVTYQDGVIIAARTDGKVVRIGYSGTEETLLQVDGTGLDWRGLYMDSNENVYASPHASNGTLTMTERGLYRLSKGANSFTKVISLYNPSSTIPTEAEQNNDTIWTMCEDAYGNLYAGVYSHTIHQNPAIYKSTDGGLTWAYIYNFYTAGDTPGSNARHIHSIVYSKWQDALYCIVGEVNTIFKSTNGGITWTNLNIRLEHDKGSAMLPVENGILIGSDGAYNCAIDILYNDDYNHETVWLGWANTVFGIRQSDETGMIYAFCKIDSSAKSTSYFPPSSVLNLSGDAQTAAINTWKSGVSEATAASWQNYHDSVVAKYPDDSIIPQHYAILVSRDGGRHFEPLKRWKVNDIQPYGFWTVGYFMNGECLAGRYVNGYVRPIAVSEGKHKYISGGCDLTGEILVRTNTSATVEVITQ